MFGFFNRKKRIYITAAEVLHQKSFLIWFTMVNFPDGFTKNEDSLYDIMEDKYDSDIEEWYINKLAGYYDGVFDKTNGYIETPKTIQLELATSDKWYIEFHPGDNVYYFNKKRLGCTGPEYSIQKITFSEFMKYTEGMSLLEKLLILPMVKITLSEKELFSKLVYSIIKEINYIESDIDNICECIIDNCLAK